MPHNKDNSQKHKEIMTRWDTINDAEKDQRLAANKDARFAHIEGEQWSDSDKSARAQKPMYEINRVVGSINLVTGTQRQNSISMKTIPLGSGATKGIATTLNGLSRNIENRSKFDNIQANAFKEVATGGYGAWQVTTGYSNDQSFEQDISIKGIKDAANSVFFDNGSSEDNHRDANDCFVIADIPTSQFKKEYPDSIVASMDNQDGYSRYTNGWCSADNVRIADYWVKEPFTIEIVQMSTGKVYEVNEDFEKIVDELAEKNITEIARRKKKSHKIVHYKVSGAEILEGAQSWDGIYIPVIMPLGYTTWIEGKRYVRGLVRMAKDAQRLYNYSRSAIVEAQNESVGDSTWLTANQAKGHESTIGQHLPVKIYNTDPTAPPPFKLGSAPFQNALKEISDQAADDVKTTTGFFDQSLGNDPNAQSGRAILAIQQQGDLGTFELQDNLVKAVEYTDEIIIDLLPRIYDTERQEMILNPDGNEEIVYINKAEVDEQTGDEVILNDLSLGTYGVVASNGANYKTKQIEAINTMIALSETSPLVAEVIPDIVLENMDSPVAEKVGKRVHGAMLQTGAIQPTEEEIKEAQEKAPKPSEAEQMQAQLGQLAIEKAELENENLAADQDKVVAETEKIKADTAKAKADTAKSYADTNKSFADANKNSLRETPSEINAQEKAADAANTIIEETFEEEIIDNQQEIFPGQEIPLNNNDLQNQEI